jgi:uncharacterized protein (TIGR01777 family)
LSASQDGEDGDMRIAITGSSGLIGSALVSALRVDGHDVRRIVRRTAAADDEASWEPQERRIDPRALDGVDAVINLAGAGLGDHRWSDEYRHTLLSSRVDATATISDAIAERRDQVAVLISASAVGWYGDRGEETVDESDPAGTGFLADLVHAWEAECAPAADAGVRLINARTGIVLSADGGALGKVLPLFRLGLGGRLGSGRQWMSWISLPDYVAAVRFLLSHPVSGPVNLTAPQPVRNRDYTREIGHQLGRPTFATAPAAALRLAMPGFADEAILASQRVLPHVLREAGFEFGHPDITTALSDLLGPGSRRGDPRDSPTVRTASQHEGEDAL